MSGGSQAIFGRWGPRRPRLADWGGRVVRPALERLFSRSGLHSFESRPARSQLATLESAVRSGRESYVLGISTGTHNSGAALVRICASGAVELVCNEEEERYTAVKHCMDYPSHSIEAIRRRLAELGVEPGELAACVSSWDYAPAFVTFFVRPLLEEAPASLAIARHELQSDVVSQDIAALRNAPRRLAEQLGLNGRMPTIGMRHHDCHAYFSYAVSPFAREREPTMALVADGTGDDASTSLYACQPDRLTLLSAQGTSILDSLGAMYGYLSSTQGGWPLLSSEGRYMGAAAWGNGDRLTNRYYRRLKHLLHFGAGGEVHLNRALVNWTRASWVEPYSEELLDILGEPIPLAEMWHPDAVLNVEDVRHPEITQARVDKAAAVQMVFEDALVHIVEHLIRTTGSHRLVLSGGTALNCVANMRLLESFDEHWYAREMGRPNTRLHLWVPPTPGDAGAPLGAAYAFAMRAGAMPGAPLRHAFHCGHSPTVGEIRAAIRAAPAARALALGDCSDPQTLARVADLLAYAVAGGRVVGLYQGPSETGPRALGHRSILANPCDPAIRRVLNERVKHRELIRPLAPMLTRAAAERFFHLHAGASDDDYNAYNYMVLTARARPGTREAIPAVIHRDGTGRLQIVRPDVDPLCHAFLLAMGRRVGVEASVNTSLNVGAPIAHTPTQALATLERARGMDGLLMIGAEGEAMLVWLDDRAAARERLLESVREWARESGEAPPTLLDSLPRPVPASAG
ncbi:MAG TPA: carbamoyltransferase C-terminal domain-containing protein [Solirubrobacteraceae bacterium]|jgi:carbamoyltransferase|nr:carbamoyltransferase C-terminal domain-containing protein [Solirubrobacteraceae bacterium]